MFGFANSNKDKHQMGGEIFRETQKRRKIILAIIGIVAFIIFNVILYFLTNM